MLIFCGREQVFKNNVFADKPPIKIYDYKLRRVFKIILYFSQLVETWHKMPFKF